MRFEFPILILLLDARHGDDDLGGRPDLPLCRRRAAVAGALRAGRLPPRRRQVVRGGPEVFRARRAVVGPAALRRLADLRLRRHRHASPASRPRPQGGHAGIGLLFGLVFLVGGLAFKVSAVPFHMWTPDVYEGAPTPVVAFFAAAPKLAAMALMVRVFIGAFPGAVNEWHQIIVFISIASMALGAFAAIGQTQHQAPAGLFLDRQHRLRAGRPRRRHGRGRAGRADLHGDLSRHDARRLRLRADDAPRRQAGRGHLANSPACRAPMAGWRLRCR